jgi:DsbC/DsbD-like thiol-disulfide interchange protein
MIPFCAALILSAGASLAQDADAIARIEVLPGWRTAAGTQMAALRLTLAPGWKTYWRSPGDAGIPPIFDWSGSVNVGIAKVHWPVPEVFHLNGMRSIGYTDQVILPVELSVTDPGQPVQLSGFVDMGVCEDVCVPVSLTFDATLQADGRRDPAIAAALVDQPLTEAEANVGSVTCTTEPSRSGLRLTTTMAVPRTGADEIVVIEAGDPHIWVSEAETSREGDQLIASADLVNVSGNAFVLNRSAVRITVLGSDRAVDIQGCTGG